MNELKQLFMEKSESELKLGRVVGILRPVVRYVSA